MAIHQQSPREAQQAGLDYLADTIPQAQTAFLDAETYFDKGLDALLAAMKLLCDMRDGNAALLDRLPGNDRLEDAVDQLKRAEDVLTFQVIAVTVEAHSICSYMARMLAVIREMDARHTPAPDGPKRAASRPLRLTAPQSDAADEAPTTETATVAPPDTPVRTMDTITTTGDTQADEALARMATMPLAAPLVPADDEPPAA